MDRVAVRPAGTAAIRLTRPPPTGRMAPGESSVSSGSPSRIRSTRKSSLVIVPVAVLFEPIA